MKNPTAVLSLTTLLFAAQIALSQSSPTHGWPKATPASLGIEADRLKALDVDFANGKYPLVDSMTVIRCGQLAYERKYSHDYAKIYYKEAHTVGPLNAHLTGPYNYFDPDWHPYYQGTDEHTMQSVSKSVTSVIYGVAITRGDFKASIDTPVLSYFKDLKVANVDDRKRRMTIRDLLTMSSGLDWDEEVAYDDPRNACSQMEATDDWVQYVIDRPMAHESGKVFAYSSGATEVLAYIFKAQTGQDIEEYGRKYLFTPLGIDHYQWKRTPKGVVDTEGGLFLRAEDLAKIGYLYLHHGMWDGRQVVSEDWVKRSLTPAIEAEEGMKYGFQWWLLPHGQPERMVWTCLGFGGQRLLVFPEYDLMMVFTGWKILGNGDTFDSREIMQRLLPGVHEHACQATSH